MGCAPADDDDLVEAVRLLVAERDGARAELEASERARYAAEDERDTVLELVADDAVRAARERDDRDAARLAALATLRVALADAEADRDRARAALAAERARCAAVCREVSRFYDAGDVGSVVARACADEIEREEVDR
jgi:hypothetical protein